MTIDSSVRKIIKDFGYIRIDDMMREALSKNTNSYYKSKSLIGVDGDFITSPEISQLFGETIALWAITKWQELGSPKEIALIELGPGRGVLMRDLMRISEIVPEFNKAIEIFLYEINEGFIKEQKNTLASIKQKINWINNITKIPTVPCIIISNEFFDALPIRRYIKNSHEWFESVIVQDTANYRLKFDQIKLDQNLLNQLNNTYQNAQDGAFIEESDESLEIMCKIADHLLKSKGACLTIDYGYNIKTSERTSYQYNSSFVFLL